MSEIIIWGFLCALYYTLHSLFALESVKKKLQSKWIGKSYYRIFYNVVAIISLIPLVLYYLQLPSNLVYESFFLKIVGGLCLLMGGVIMLLALRNYDLSEFIGLRYLEKKRKNQTDELITDGLNGLVRHPLYFAAVLIFWGSFLFIPELKILIMAAVTQVYLFFGIRLEEQKLIRSFGKAYLDYQKEVPMLFPVWRKKQKKEP